MKYLSEYRDPAMARALVTEIRRSATRRWVLMEVCGGQTHTIVKQGLDERLVDLLERRDAHGTARPVHHLDRLAQQLVQPLLHDGVRLTAADFHQYPSPRTGVGDLGCQASHDALVAIFVDEFHSVRRVLSPFERARPVCRGAVIQPISL